MTALQSNPVLLVGIDFSDCSEVEMRVLIGNPAARLLKAAEQVGAASIVLGAHGRRALPRSKL